MPENDLPASSKPADFVSHWDCGPCGRGQGGLVLVWPSTTPLSRTLRGNATVSMTRSQIKLTQRRASRLVKSRIRLHLLFSWSLRICLLFCIFFVVVEFLLDYPDYIHISTIKFIMHSVDTTNQPHLPGRRYSFCGYMHIFLIFLLICSTGFAPACAQDIYTCMCMYRYRLIIRIRYPICIIL